MNLFAHIFDPRPRWVQLETLYSAQRLDTVRLFLTENRIPHRVRAAMLPAGLAAAGPTRSLWYLSVREQDLPRVQHYLRTERDY